MSQTPPSDQPSTPPTRRKPSDLPITGANVTIRRLRFYAPGLSLDALAGISAIANLGASHPARMISAETAEMDWIQLSQQVNPENLQALRAWCQEKQIECAALPIDFDINHLGLMAMDMDSTLITIECIDEIADYAGKKAEVSAITAAAMRGEITSFSESLTRRVALLAGLPATVLEQVYEERLQLSPGAEALIAWAKKRGIQTLLVSGGFTFFTSKVAARLGLDAHHSNQLEIIDGKLTGRVTGNIVDAQGKADHLSWMAQYHQLPMTSTIAIGDGANDLTMMAISGLSVAYHAKPVVAAAADIAIQHHGLDSLVRLLGS